MKSILRKNKKAVEPEKEEFDIYESFNKKEEVKEEVKPKDNYLETHSTVTRSSKASRLILVGFYLFIILICVIIFFLLRADRYEFYLVKEEVNLGSGSSYQVELTPKYERYFDYLNYKYEIADEKVATVDEFGTITAKGSGTTTLTISLSPGIISKKMRINSDIVSIENLELLVYKNNKLQQGNTYNMEVNSTVTLKAIADSNEKSFIDVVYNSSDESIATVDEFGNVTAIGIGEVVITGTKDDVSGEITITVKEKEVTPTPTPTTPSKTNVITKVNISTNQVTKYVGEVVRLSATRSPISAPVKRITWSSSNSKVATVSATGEVKAIKKGTAIITVDMDGVKDTCTVIVKEKGTSTTPTPTPTPAKTAPTGKQSSVKVVTLSTTSLTIDKGKTATFTIKAKSAVCDMTVKSENTKIATVSSTSDDYNDDLAFFDAFDTSNSSKTVNMTFTVKGVSSGTTYIDINNISCGEYASDGNIKEYTGSGKIGILVK